MVSPTIRVTVDATAKGALARIANAIDDYTVARRSAVDAIVRRGLAESMRILGAGGDVETASGGLVEWSRERHPWTKRIRRFVFDDLDHDYEPFLRLTGKLQLRTVAGQTLATQHSLTYRVPEDVDELVRVHQLGLAPLPDRRDSPGHIDRVPARPIVFWSRHMADEVRRDAEAYFRRVASGGVE